MSSLGSEGNPQNVSKHEDVDLTKSLMDINDNPDANCKTKSLMDYLEDKVEEEEKDEIVSSKRAIMMSYLEDVIDNLTVNEVLDDFMDDRNINYGNNYCKQSRPQQRLTLDMMRNPYLNFLREYRMSHDYSGYKLLQRAAHRWQTMSSSERWFYSPELYRLGYGKLSGNSDSDDDDVDYNLGNDSDNQIDITDTEKDEKKAVYKPKRKPASGQPKRKKRGCKPKPKPIYPKRKKRVYKPKAKPKSSSSSESSL